MMAIGVMNIVTVPLISWFGAGDTKYGYLAVAVLYGIIFAACHLFCFHKTKEVVEVPVGQKLPLKVQVRSVMKNKPYLLALLGQLLFGFIHYGQQRRHALLFHLCRKVRQRSLLLFHGHHRAKHHRCSLLPSGIQKNGQQGFHGSHLRFPHRYYDDRSVLLQPKRQRHHVLSVLSFVVVFFSGFNTAIYAIIPDCVEYGEWKTGIRNDGFQYAFISLGNKDRNGTSAHRFSPLPWALQDCKQRCAEFQKY